jgi:hypothetical protein
MKYRNVVRGLVLGLGLLASALAHSALPAPAAQQLHKHENLPFAVWAPVSRTRISAPIVAAIYTKLQEPRINRGYPAVDFRHATSSHNTNLESFFVKGQA